MSYGLTVSIRGRLCRPATDHWRLGVSSNQSPEVFTTITDEFNLCAPYGAMVTLRAHDLDQAGKILVTFQRVFIAADAAPAEKPGESIQITDWNIK